MNYCILLLAALSVWAQQSSSNPQPPAASAGTAVPKTFSPLANAAPAKPAADVAPNAVVITVGEVKITKEQFERVLASIPEPQRAQFSTPAGKKRLAEQYVELETLAQEARTRKLDEDPIVKAEIELNTEKALAQKLYQEFLAEAKPDDLELRAYYEGHKAEFEEIKAKHILIRFKGSTVPLKAGAQDRTDAEALAFASDLRAKILAGANFDELAKANSDDAGNAQSGGELGTFGHGRMVPQFEKAAFAAEIGKVSEPVKTQFGYHLILVEEHKTKPFEEVKAQIETHMKPEAAQKAVADLKKKTAVTYDEAYFGPAAPPAPKLAPPK